MTGVYQRIVDPGNGDCMKCTVATLLNLGYDPNPEYKYLKGYPAKDILGFNGVKTIYLFKSKPKLTD